MTTNTDDPAMLEAQRDRMLAALWRCIWHPYLTVTTPTVRLVEEYACRECHAHGPVKAAVRHVPGCALFGLDPALLAGLDAFEITEGEPV